jgi:uncharacterized protein (DUF305 family)
LTLPRLLLAAAIALILAPPCFAAPVDSGENPADAAFLQAMRGEMIGMHQSMPTGDTDSDFARFLLPHDQTSIDLAKAELQFGKDPELKTLATEIIAAQDKEIALLKAWLAKNAK